MPLRIRIAIALRRSLLMRAEAGVYATAFPSPSITDYRGLSGRVAPTQMAVEGPAARPSCNLERELRISRETSSVLKNGCHLRRLPRSMQAPLQSANERLVRPPRKR